MARLQFRGRQSTNRSLLLLAIGAVTGLTLGVVLAERAGGTKGLKARVRSLSSRRQRDVLLDVEAEDAPALLGDSDSMHDSPDVELIETTGEFDELAVDGPDEDELESRVLEAFRNDPTLRGRPIDIGAIGDGIIELTGWVHSAAEVGHALTLARGVPDVAHVMDRLTIRGTDFSRSQSPSAER